MPENDVPGGHVRAANPVDCELFAFRSIPEGQNRKLNTNNLNTDNDNAFAQINTDTVPGGCAAWRNSKRFSIDLKT